MTVIHKQLAEGRWHTMTLMEQMGNIGSEVDRTLRAKRQGDEEKMLAAFYRALELFDLTLDDPKLKGRLKEIARTREVFCDMVVGENQYRVSDESLSKYFLEFGIAARLSR